MNDLTPSDVCDLLDENSYYAPEVIYYADAWEIVAGSSFNKYTADFLDFSECESSLDCIMQEANALVNDVYYSEREAIASEVLEGLQNKDEYIWNKSDSRLNGLYWAESNNGEMLSFIDQDELHCFLNK
ncbi:MAG: hypothetical protein RR623_00355 [Bacilli bacterium]